MDKIEDVKRKSDILFCYMELSQETKRRLSDSCDSLYNKKQIMKGVNK